MQLWSVHPWCPSSGWHPEAPFLAVQATYCWLDSTCASSDHGFFWLSSWTFVLWLHLWIFRPYLCRHLHSLLPPDARFLQASNHWCYTCCYPKAPAIFRSRHSLPWDLFVCIYGCWSKQGWEKTGYADFHWQSFEAQYEEQPQHQQAQSLLISPSHCYLSLHPQLQNVGYSSHPSRRNQELSSHHRSSERSSDTPQLQICSCLLSFCAPKRSSHQWRVLATMCSGKRMMSLDASMLIK